MTVKEYYESGILCESKSLYEGSEFKEKYEEMYNFEYPEDIYMIIKKYDYYEFKMNSFFIGKYPIIVMCLRGNYDNTLSGYYNRYPSYKNNGFLRIGDIQNGSALLYKSDTGEIYANDFAGTAGFARDGIKVLKIAESLQDLFDKIYKNMRSIEDALGMVDSQEEEAESIEEIRASLIEFKDVDIDKEQAIKSFESFIEIRRNTDEEQIKLLEKRYNISLGDDIKEFLINYGGTTLQLPVVQTRNKNYGNEKLYLDAIAGFDPNIGGSIFFKNDNFGGALEHGELIFASSIYGMYTYELATGIIMYWDSTEKFELTQRGLSVLPVFDNIHNFIGSLINEGEYDEK